MNKTLLIIICDFLLISILALVEFKPNIEAEAVDEEALRDEAAEEMLELLQLSLEHESSQRSEIESALDETRGSLEEKEQAIQEKEQVIESVSSTLQERESELQEEKSEKAQLASRLDETLSSLELTIEEKTALADAVRQNEERARRLQEELQSQQEVAAARAAALEEAQENLNQLESRQQELSTQLQIRDTEKKLLEENLLTARTEVERARIEAERAQQRSENLAAGVSELAASSTEIREQIRQGQPLSLNAIYKQFEDNRVFLRFRWRERAFLGTNERQAALQTLMVETPDGIHAVFATANTPLANPDRTLETEAVLTIGERSFSVKEVGFLDAQRSVASVKVPASIAGESGLRVFPLSTDPFRFSEAVLVSDDQELYGEIPVRVPPGEPDFLEVESRLFNRLFGEFSPTAGDYVFSMTGELIGIMIRGDRARMLKEPSFEESVRLP